MKRILAIALAGLAFGAGAAEMKIGFVNTERVFREAAAQSNDPFDLVIVPIGVGSLAASAVRFAVHQRPGAAVIGVEPVSCRSLAAALEAGHPVDVDVGRGDPSGQHGPVPGDHQVHADAGPFPHEGLGDRKTKPLVCAGDDGVASLQNHDGLFPTLK